MRRNLLLSAMGAFALLAGSGHVATAQGDVWSVGQDEAGCFAATVREGIGITYSTKDRYQMFIVGGTGASLTPSPDVEFRIGNHANRLRLKGADTSGGWMLDPGVGMETIKALTEEILKGRGPLTVRSEEAGFAMTIETDELRGQAIVFNSCVLQLSALK